VLTEEDIRLLQAARLDQVWVAEPGSDEVGEDEVAMEVAARIGSGSVEVRPDVGGRANLLAGRDCCVLVNDSLLRRINASAAVVVATVPNFSHAKLGQRIATVKSAPFAAPQREVERVLELLGHSGPLVQARPLSNGPVAVLYCDPMTGARAKQLFERIVRARLERLGVRAGCALAVREQEFSVARGLEHLLRVRPVVVLVASTTAPATPDDVVGGALRQIGGAVERFMAPVEPGNLLLLAYKQATPIVSAPGCFRSLKPNVIDLLLPPLLAGYRVSAEEVAGLGLGGLVN
jgi:molybdenum cofactor cytidylyltransferase